MSCNKRKRTNVKLLAAIGLLAMTLGARAYGQSSGIDNARIIKMAGLGLDDDIIIAKIKSSKCSFQVSEADLLELTKARISAKVQAAMVEASKVTVTRVVIDAKPVDLHLFTQLYMTQPFLSLSKTKLSLPGKHSAVVVGSTPEIVMDFAQGDAISSYVLVQLEGKDNHRELPLANSILGGVTGYASSRGDVSKDAIRPTTSARAGDGKMKIVPVTPLKPGEYLVYVVGSYERIRWVFARGYDFTVQQTPESWERRK